MDQNENLIDVIALLYKWKKHILGASFLAAIFTAAASLTMPNFYQAHTLFYSANPDLAAPTPIGQSTGKTFVFGSDNDLDRLFSISKSSAVKDHLTKKFNLYKHYDIDSTGELAKHKLNLKLNKLYETTKTKYDAIDLSIEDTDPVLSAAMANEARNKIDALAQKLIKDSQGKQIASLEAGIEANEIKYSSLLDSLNKIRAQFNIFSTEAQGESYGSNLVKVEGAYLKASGSLSYLKNTSAPADTVAKIAALKRGLEQQLDKLKSDVQSYNKGYPVVKNLERVTRDVSGQMQLKKSRLAALQATYDAKITAIHVVEEASTPVYKSRPKRSILTIGASFLTFVLMSFWVLIREQFRKNNWKEAFDNA